MALPNSFKDIGLSASEIEALTGYSKLILDANRGFNLIAKSTEELIWERHIHDSAQLVSLIPKDAKSFCDVGCYLNENAIKVRLFITFCAPSPLSCSHTSSSVLSPTSAHLQTPPSPAHLGQRLASLLDMCPGIVRARPPPLHLCSSQ